MQNARCLVVPTRTWEGCPLVVLEGFAADAPVVASNVKGMTDLIDHGRTGWLVAPDDSAALAEALTTARGCLSLEKMRIRVRARRRDTTGPPWPAVMWNCSSTCSGRSAAATAPHEGVCLAVVIKPRVAPGLPRGLITAAKR